MILVRKKCVQLLGKQVSMYDNPSLQEVESWKVAKKLDSRKDTINIEKAIHSIGFWDKGQKWKN